MTKKQIRELTERIVREANLNRGNKARQLDQMESELTRIVKAAEERGFRRGKKEASKAPTKK